MTSNTNLVRSLNQVASVGKPTSDETELYAPWQPSVLLAREERLRLAVQLLRKAHKFPSSGTRCLEVGVGGIGWLADLINWGVRESNLHGIDSDPERLKIAQQHLPAADLREGDVTRLPWESNSFELVIASTLFTSILSDSQRQLAADEIVRVLAPGGALLWYDFAFNSPRNHRVRKVAAAELRRLFGTLEGEIRSARLAPPLARLVAPRSWLVAQILSSIPFLRTHLIAVLTKS
jgi:SAM-dependent methyltransferase